jgi:hypothetical protein
MPLERIIIVSQEPQGNRTEKSVRIFTGGGGRASRLS